MTQVTQKWRLKAPIINIFANQMTMHHETGRSQWWTHRELSFFTLHSTVLVHSPGSHQHFLSCDKDKSYQLCSIMTKIATSWLCLAAKEIDIFCQWRPKQSNNSSKHSTGGHKYNSKWMPMLFCICWMCKLFVTRFPFQPKWCQVCSELAVGWIIPTDENN